MKRLLCISICLLLLAVMLPVTASAEGPAVAAEYRENVLYLTWAETSLTLNVIADGSGNMLTPRTASEGSAEVDVELSAGDHGFSAYFNGAEGGVVSTFTVTVPEEQPEIPPAFTLLEVEWDETSLALTVNWEAIEGMSVRAIHVGGMEVPVDNADGVFVRYLDELPFGQHTVEYVVDYNGQEILYHDTEFTILRVGGRVDTALTVEEQDGFVAVYVQDAYQRPLSGVTVYLEAGTTSFSAVTDESGYATFPLTLADATRIYTADLEDGETVYVGSEYTELVVPTTTPTTTPTTEKTEAATTSTKRSTTRRKKTTTTEATTTTTAGHATHVGAGTTGAEDEYVALNVLTNEVVLEAVQLSASSLDAGARLLLEPAVYQSLAASADGRAMMLSILNSDYAINTNQAKTILNSRLKSYDSASIRTLTVELGLIYWDAKTQSGVVADTLPEGSYVVRLPLPKTMEGCNRVYVVDMADGEPGDYIEANADNEFVQFNLSGLGPVALVACQGEEAVSTKYVHPVVYVFFTVGGLLLLLACVMIYFFFIRKGERVEEEYDEGWSEEITTDEEVAPDETEDPSADPEEDISLGDFLRRHKSSDEE